MERKTEDVVIRTWEVEAGGHRNIGRTKLRWRDVIRKDMKEKQVKYKKKTKKSKKLNRAIVPLDLDK